MNRFDFQKNVFTALHFASLESGVRQIMMKLSITGLPIQNNTMVGSHAGVVSLATKMLRILMHF